jgi:pimeloyl-ACP methyl ester carboxylesterase
MPASKPEPLVLARWEIHPSGGGPPLRGDLRARRGPTPRSVVVLCHGFKGFKDWGFFPSLARALARRGHAALSFNLSRGGIGDDGVDFSALDRFAEQTHSRNLEEIRLVLDAVTTGRLFPEPPLHVGLFGHSRGGGEVVLTAAADPRIDALVTWAAIARVERAPPEQAAAWARGETVLIENSRTGQQMPVGPAYWRDIQHNRDRLDIAAAAARVQIPWLIVHGEDDATVPADEARTLFEAAGPDVELLRVQGAGHTFGAVHPYAGPTPELRAAADATLTWFDAHLA